MVDCPSRIESRDLFLSEPNDFPKAWCVWFVLAFFVLAFLGAGLCQSSETDSAGESISVQSPVLKAIESISIPAQVSGLIMELQVKEGDTLAPGQLIGRVRDKATKVELTKAKLAVQLARQKLENDIEQRMAAKSEMVAKNEYERAIDANRKVVDVYPENEIDRLKLIFDRAVLEKEKATYQRELAKTELAMAEADVDRLQDVLDRHAIIAPCQGMVVAIDKRVGEWCEAGGSVITILQTDVLRIEGLVTSSEASQLEKDLEAQVTVDLGKGQSYQALAKLVFISPEANPVNGQVRVFLEMKADTKRVRPGMRPKVDVALTHRKP